MEHFFISHTFSTAISPIKNSIKPDISYRLRICEFCEICGSPPYIDTFI
nr:MAG TPA: dehydrogenase accessory protein [Bacteriophage sp.]